MVTRWSSNTKHNSFSGINNNLHGNLYSCRMSFNRKRNLNGQFCYSFSFHNSNFNINLLGQLITFTATPNNGGSAPTYQWKINGADVAGANSSTFTSSTLNNGDVVSVVMTSNESYTTTPTAVSNSITITAASVTPAVSITASSTAICSGSSITFTATVNNGGSAPTYQWKINGADVAGANSSTFTSSSLNDGDAVSVVMTSNANCTTTPTASSNSISITTASVTPAVSITANTTTICSGAPITFTATPTNGGSTPTYQWKVNGADVAGANSATYTSSTLNNGDIVTVVMTSNAGCANPLATTSNSITVSASSVTPSVSITSGPSPTCAGSNTIFITTTTDGGNAPTFQWQVNSVNVPGAIGTAFISILQNGDVVTVVMTSNAGCTTTPTATSNAITVSVISITATATAPDIGCGQTTGTITVNASGGISPYNYSINAGNTYQPSNVFSSLAAGSYTIRIKDAANCTADINVTINQTNSTLAATVSAPDIACGQATGSITVNVSGGTSPYSYSINAGSSYQSSNVFNGLSAGSYAIRINDAANGTVDINVSINQSNSTLAATASAPDIACGQATGTITVSVSGGNVPYSYSIDAGNTYQTSNVFNGLAPGTYLIKVKDANGCLLDLTATLNSAGMINLQISNPLPVCAPATIDLTAASITTGSDAGLSFTYWNDPSATIPVTNPNAIVNTSVYYIKATSLNGCFITKPVAVNI